MSLETVQYIFYLLGSIYLLGGVIAIIIVIYVLFEIKNKIDETSEYVKREVQELKLQAIEKSKEMIEGNKGKLLGLVGTAVTGFVMTSLRNKIFGKKK
jgi:hypothetical protein